MPNMRKLSGKIIEEGKNIDDLADAIGMHRSTMYRKFSKNGESFTVREVNKIISELRLSFEDAAIIFFTHTVA